MLGVILAAGRGTRLGSLTAGRSKAMLPILGRPLIARVMDSLVTAGVRDVIVVIAAGDDELRGYLHLRRPEAVRLRFVVQSERRGMADALCRAAPLIDRDFVLSACDNLITDEDMTRLAQRWRDARDVDALLALLRVAPQSLGRSGVVQITGERINRIIEKPGPGQAPSDIASLPLYYFNRRILSYLPDVTPSPRGEYELQDAIQRLIDGGGDVQGQVISGRLTVTSPTDLLDVNIAFLQRPGLPASRPPLPGRVDTSFLEPLYIDPDVTLGSGCVIGPNVYLERGSAIGAGARVSDAVVLRDATVAPGTFIARQVVGPTERLA